jgi:RNAse (barnase) inhibitor barstar
MPAAALWLCLLLWVALPLALAWRVFKRRQV